MNSDDVGDNVVVGRLQICFEICNECFTSFLIGYLSRPSVRRFSVEVVEAKTLELFS